MPQVLLIHPGRSAGSFAMVYSPLPWANFHLTTHLSIFWRMFENN
jgi:hypothetical protein